MSIVNFLPDLLMWIYMFTTAETHTLLHVDTELDTDNCGTYLSLDRLDETRKLRHLNLPYPSLFCDIIHYAIVIPGCWFDKAGWISGKLVVTLKVKRWLFAG